MFTIKRMGVGVTVAMAILANAATSRADDPPSLFRYDTFNGYIHFALTATGKMTPSRGFTINVNTPINQGWQNARRFLTVDFPKRINQSGPSFRGFKPYDVVIRPGTIRATGLASRQEICLEYIIPGNRIEATFTTPSIVKTKVPVFGSIDIGLDRRADPRIAVDFDIVLRATIAPQLHAVPRLSSASISVRNARLSSRNLSADVLSMANDVVAWVGGPNFRMMAEQEINKQGGRVTDPLANMLKGLNAKVAPLTANVRSFYVTFQGGRFNVIYSTQESMAPVLR